MEEKEKGVYSANSIIESMGVYFPERTVTTKNILESCKNLVMYPLERITGIESRRMAGQTEFSIDLAKNSIAECLRRSKYRPEDIDLLICCNISRYDEKGAVSFEPSTAVQLKHHFSLSNAICFDISNACAGMFTGVNIADSFLKAGVANRALVVSGEYITHLTNTVQKEISDQKDDNRMACLTLGDSGAAVILERSTNNDYGFHDIDMLTLGDYSDLCIAEPTSEDHGGFVMITNASKLHHVAITESIKMTVDKIRKYKLQGSLNHFLMHQTASSAIKQTYRGINQLLGGQLWNSNNVIDNLRYRGNTSTTSHFVALWDKIHDDTIQNYESVMFTVQASGITLGVMPYTLDDLPERIRNDKTPQKLLEAAKLSDKPEQKTERITIRASGLDVHRSGKADSLVLATNAVKNALGETDVDLSEYDLMINAGVYRNNYLAEPAVATMVAGNIKLNSDVEDWQKSKTFAFDIINGACGFLYTCFTAESMLKSGKFNKAICVTSEIENNKQSVSDKMVGIKESGAALLLEKTKENQGFIDYHFSSFTDHLNQFRSKVITVDKNSYLDFKRDDKFEESLINCIDTSCEEFLAKHNLSFDDIALVFPPQMCTEWIRNLGKKLNLNSDKLIIVEEDNTENYYTTSIPFCLRHVESKGLAKEGEIALMIEAGSGINVALALYQF
ncbi:MAG: hypothetical protein MJH11_01840 [Lentisphaeria bacterium]|nr:hypothetical protein [Lentisphaeria bacterium]